MRPPILILMGVSGCGKTEVGRLLARRLNCPFIEGDEFHPPANVAKMRSGRPLDDDDRKDWMAALRAEMERQTGRAALSCSALKRKYRAYLCEVNRPVHFLHLHGERALLEERIGSRQGHFFDPKLLGSQLEALEVPDESENAHVLSIDDTVENIVAQALRLLKTCGFSTSP